MKPQENVFEATAPFRDWVAQFGRTASQPDMGKQLGLEPGQAQIVDSVFAALVENAVGSSKWTDLARLRVTLNPELNYRGDDIALRLWAASSSDMIRIRDAAYEKDPDDLTALSALQDREAAYLRDKLTCGLGRGAGGDRIIWTEVFLDRHQQKFAVGLRLGEQ